MQSDPAEVTTRSANQERHSHEEIAALAYAFWMERGYPVGSPEEDWFRAVQELHRRKRLPNALRELIDLQPSEPDLAD